MRGHDVIRTVVEIPGNAEDDGAQSPPTIINTAFSCCPFPHVTNLVSHAICYASREKCGHGCDGGMRVLN